MIRRAGVFLVPRKAAREFSCGGAVVLVALLLWVGCDRPRGAALGPALFETCATCHGRDGEGSATFAAPAIAGMPEWYLLGQLEKYRDGHRGARAEDRNGSTMRAMVGALDGDGDLEAIAAFVAAMPAVAPAPVRGGDADRGRVLYPSCAPCHGDNAAGNVERNAPPLTGLNDWYIIAQLQLFKAGLRGSSEGDIAGAQMRPMAVALADERAMADVAAFIATLRRR